MEKSNTEIPASGGKDKQKLIIVGVLGVLVIGIGAFQFMGGEPAKKPVAKKSTSDPDSKKPSDSAEPVDEKKIDLGRLIAGNLPPRDPFRPVDIPAVPDPKPSSQPGETEKPEKVEQAPPKSEPTPSGPRSTGAMRPPSMSGQAPLNPMGGLPPAGAIGAGPGMAIQAGTPLRQPGEPAYSVAGVVIGKERMVVLQDDNGNQRLVKLGEKIDPDNRIVDIDRGGKVKVRNGKKTMELPAVPAETPKPGSPNTQGQPTF
ncbi:MAG: hypothetical protein K1X67_19115 [Fimbriimonadaceae bacterium]|nr:hypothetical protein [Fimbriimonadaceae bacterium]